MGGSQRQIRRASGGEGDRNSRGKIVFPQSERSGRRRRERPTIRTWTLDALRAATEPVKVEAMHAILVFGFGGVVCVCVCGNDENAVTLRIFISRKNSCHLTNGDSHDSASSG